MRVQDHEYRYGETPMVYTEFASTDTGAQQALDRTFVLVHGIGMGRVVFTQTAEILARFGRVLTVDLPGFGDSPKPSKRGTIEETAGLLAHFIADIAAGTGRLTLVGHSMGTQVVAELALQRPELADSIVLIAPTVNRYERRTFTQLLRLAQDVSDDSWKVVLTGLGQYLQANPLETVHKMRSMLRHHLEVICPQVTVPALVMRGEEDRVCPHRWTTEVAKTFPRAQLREIPDRGHEAVIDDPEPAASMILEFVLHPETRRFIRS